MNAQKTHSWKRRLALVALLGSLSATGTVLGDDEGGLRITPELTARWWQWALAIPSSVHPLSQKASDPTGANYCMVGQHGGAWFLGGIFKVVDGPPASVDTPSAGNGGTMPDEITRACTIPLGTPILMPVLNAACDTAGEVASGNPVPDDLPGKTRHLRACAKTPADAINPETATAAFGPVDARGRWSRTPVDVHRVHTDRPFSVTYAPDNILSSNCGGSPHDEYLCAPAPNPSLAQADGYWVQVRPPTPGTYQLETFGEAPAFEFALRLTYTLTVVGPQDQ